MLTTDRATATFTARAASVIQDLYGISIRTPWPVTGLPRRMAGCWDVEFIEGDPKTFAEAASHVAPAHARRWAQYAALPDGSSYRRWTDLFEFVVTPDARQIQARLLKDANEEALLAYLLVDALSFSMIRLGREPLHATAVLTEQGVVAFLGESGYGKSTLAALFVRGGFPLVTDDMLVLTAERNGFLAHSGPPRIKLYRDIADRIFGDGYRGVPMNPVTEKVIIPLDETQTVRQPFPLCGLYVIRRERGGPWRDRPFIRRLSPARALPRILAATASHWADEPDRLKRQFEFVTRLLQCAPVKTLSYHRNKEDVFHVRDAVLADLARDTG
jgi:hypothetical protein